MTTPATVSMPALSNLPGVELIHTGSWFISSGPWDATADDLMAAVAAMECPAVRRPVLKLGHVDPRFDGEPAVGWVDNLAVTDNGQTLVGDYVGMPGWLGPVLASAYPDRSIEGRYGGVCQLGHTHPFILDAVALLGVMHPGVGTLASLQDVATLYGVTPVDDELLVEVAAGAPADGGTLVRATMRATTEGRPTMPDPNPRHVAASATTEDVRTAFYDGAPWSQWITELMIEPLQLIVRDDADGTLNRIPVVIDAGADGHDAVTFGDPVRVVVRYEDVPGGVAAGAGASSSRIVYASRSESRPGQEPRPAATGPGEQEGTATMPLTDETAATIRQQLGLPDTATDAEITAALTEALNERADTPPPGDAPTTPVVPEGMTLVDQGTLNELQVAAGRGAEAYARQQDTDRREIVRAAVSDGRIPPARFDAWVDMLTRDPGASEVLAGMTKGLVPTTAIGTDSAPVNGVGADEQALYASVWGARAGAPAAGATT